VCITGSNFQASALIRGVRLFEGGTYLKILKGRSGWQKEKRDWLGDDKRHQVCTDFGSEKFLAELVSKYVFVENSNKHPFLKVEGGGAYSIISPLGWALIQGGSLFEGCLFEVLRNFSSVLVEQFLI